MMELFETVNKLVTANLNSGKRIVVHSGGTSSSKTYSILQTLLILGFQHPNSIFTIVGQDIPNLRVGAYRDFQNIVFENSNLRKMVESHNKSERVFYFSNGCTYEFNSYDGVQDAKSGKRDFLFLNEANGISYEVFEELQVRTSKKVFLDFNPTARFWAHDKLFGRDDVQWINSNYKHNYFIDPEIKAKILSYEPTEENKKRGTANEYRWKVYGLGEIGKLEGLVFPDFEIVSEYPEEYKKRMYGMDFGFSNDPTTLVEVLLIHGELFLREWIYEKGLTNQDISNKLDLLKFDKSEKIFADSAEPKSIEELRRLGWFISPSVKGRDSINYGIDLLKQYKINIFFRSKNLIEEFNSYIWAKDKDGNALNKPIDKYNHAIDAVRYAIEGLYSPSSLVY